MKRKFLTTFLIAAILFALAVVALPFVLAQSGVGENGVISSNTTWTQAGSPHTLTKNVLIANGTTLTVEQGATVNLNGYYIEVNGSLIIQSGATINMQQAAYITVNGVLQAIGTSSNPVEFNGETKSFHIISTFYSQIIFPESSIAWNEQTSTGSIIQNAILNLTNIDISASIKLASNTFIGAGISVSKGSPQITGNIVEGSIGVSGGSPLISGNRVYAISVGNTEPTSGPIVSTAIISDNVVIGGPPGGAGIAVSGNSIGFNTIIERNQVSGYNYGIEISMYYNSNLTLSITNNTVTNNAVGFYVGEGQPKQISYNNIYDNTLNVKLIADNSADFSNNWWGTSDQQAISQSIYDYNEDFNLGTVNYTPFLTAPNPDAMPNQNAPIPTDNTSASPTPITPEYPSIPFAIFVLAIVTIAIAGYKKSAKPLWDGKF